MYNLKPSSYTIIAAINKKHQFFKHLIAKSAYRKNDFAKVSKNLAKYRSLKITFSIQLFQLSNNYKIFKG